MVGSGGCATLGAWGGAAGGQACRGHRCSRWVKELGSGPGCSPGVRLPWGSSAWGRGCCLSVLGVVSPLWGICLLVLGSGLSVWGPRPPGSCFPGPFRDRPCGWCAVFGTPSGPLPGAGRCRVGCGIYRQPISSDMLLHTRTRIQVHTRAHPYSTYTHTHMHTRKRLHTYPGSHRRSFLLRTHTRMMHTYTHTHTHTQTPFCFVFFSHTQ